MRTRRNRTQRRNDDNDDLNSISFHGHVTMAVFVRFRCFALITHLFVPHAAECRSFRNGFVAYIVALPPSALVSATSKSSLSAEKLYKLLKTLPVPVIVCLTAFLTNPSEGELSSWLSCWSVALFFHRFESIFFHRAPVQAKMSQSFRERTLFARSFACETGRFCLSVVWFFGLFCKCDGPTELINVGGGRGICGALWRQCNSVSLSDAIIMCSTYCRLELRRWHFERGVLKYVYSY